MSKGFGNKTMGVGLGERGFDIGSQGMVVATKVVDKLWINLAGALKFGDS